MTRLPSLGPRGEGWFLIQLVLFGVIAASALAGPAWEGGTRVVSTAAGLLAMAAGGVLAARGIVDLRDFVTPFPYPRDDARLVQSGAYALARHPIYGGLVIGALGWALAWASPAGIALAVGLLGFFDLKSRREEAWLVERFPLYAEYRRRTRRLIPFVY